MSTATANITPDQLLHYAPGHGGFVAFASDLLLPIGGYPRFCDVMAPDQRSIIDAIAPCVEAVVLRERPPKRGLWLEATKGWGKDLLTALAIVYVLTYADWAVLAQVGADDQGQAGELKRAIDDWLRANPWLFQRVDSQRWRLVNKSTGASCEILTNDPNGAHGSRPDVLVVNEVSHVISESYALTLADNFAKRPDAFAFLATNAGHTDGWAYRWREMYREDPRWIFVKLATTPPWQSLADIAEAERRNPPVRFRRLYKGEWVPSTGGALDPDAIEASKTLLAPILSRLQGEGCVMGLDLSVTRDHSALIVLLTDHWRRRIKVAWVESFKPDGPGGQVDLQRVEQAVAWAAKNWGCQELRYDPWQAELMAQKTRLLGVNCRPVNFSGSDATLMASTLLEVFRSRIIDLYPDRDLLRDLSRLSIQERGNGQYRLTAPRDEFGHCDRAIALAMALPLAFEAIGSVVWTDPPPEVRPAVGYLPRPF